MSASENLEEIRRTLVELHGRISRMYENLQCVNDLPLLLHDLVPDIVPLEERTVYVHNRCQQCGMEFLSLRPLKDPCWCEDCLEKEVLRLQTQIETLSIKYREHQ